MRPICSNCRTEMVNAGPAVTIGYEHNNAPVDFSRAHHYTCPGCDNEVYIPLGYAFAYTVPTIYPVPDYMPISPSAPAQPKGKLP